MAPVNRDFAIGQFAGATEGPMPDSNTAYEDWVFKLGRWWAHLIPRKPTVDVFRPDTPAGLGTTSGAFF